MEVNKEEAIRCISIAQRHRSSSNLTAALRFAQKSVSLYPTPEGEKLVSIIEREIATGGSGSGSGSGGTGGASGTGSGRESPATPGSAAGTTGGGARASGVEEHVSSAHVRPGKEKAAARSGVGEAQEQPKKREYTVKQVEVVKRVKMCKHHQYYEILSLERSCSENDVKRAYKKLALALHPDKNGAPGADEAFKMVSKAFQVLSEPNLRASYDSNPSVDPTQRGAAGMSRSSAGMGGMGGMHPGFGGGGAGFQGDLNPEDLFNMFFGGGMGGGGFDGFGGRGQFGNGPFGTRVYTFGGGGGPRRAGGQAAADPAPSFAAFLPIILVALFALISFLPALFSGPHVPDPQASFSASSKFDMPRQTWQRGVPYYVNTDEWESSAIWQSVPEEKRQGKDAAMFSHKVRQFERSIESTYIHRLQNDCNNFLQRKQDRIAREAGIFGFGADYDKIREIKAEVNPSCEQLRGWGLLQASVQGF